MKWPFVSRRAYDLLFAQAMDYQDACYSAEKALAIANARYAEESLRRQKAEAEVAYRNERISRVLGLPMWPKDEEKAG